MKRLTVHRIALAAVVAALYFALTTLLAPISYGPVQFRVAEALCVLPFLFPETAVGLFVGCALANVLGGYGMSDIIFGSLATLIAGILTAKCRVKWLAPLFPVVINAIVVGAVLSFTLVPENPFSAFPLFAIEVGGGELGVLYAVGLPLLLG
ncbi:MAG: QueT transporter family protein, partial [Oscillospiraceae bacterium]|nr:QueT transporter family protein [Oscillospiraceae bacterium]